MDAGCGGWTSDSGPAERGWDCGHRALQELMLSAPKGPQTSPRNLQEVPPPWCPSPRLGAGAAARAHPSPCLSSQAVGGGGFRDADDQNQGHC